MEVSDLIFLGEKSTSFENVLLRYFMGTAQKLPWYLKMDRALDVSQSIPEFAWLSFDISLENKVFNINYTLLLHINFIHLIIFRKKSILQWRPQCYRCSHFAALSPLPSPIMEHTILRTTVPSLPDSVTTLVSIIKLTWSGWLEF